MHIKQHSMYLYRESRREIQAANQLKMQLGYLVVLGAAVLLFPLVLGQGILSITN